MGLVMDGWAWHQFALLGWLAVCFFAAGARGKGIALHRRTWWEIAQAAAIVVVMFGLLTEGKGCRSVPTADDANTVCPIGTPGC
jgi:hypothetical protein